ERSIQYVVEEEIDSLIAGCGRVMSTLLQFLKETGARIGEALMVKWIDIDFDRRIVRITPEKEGKSRMVPISPKLVEMLKSIPKKGEKVFPIKLNSALSNFCRQRKRLARKLGNPRLLKITFHTLRHWKATTEYHKTKDIMHVKELLGHKYIDNTMLYITIENALFQTTNDEFHCKATRSDEEAVKLIEAGFDYVTTTPTGLMLFRKRK
ncbi:MAG: site-specific integrase, partial [Candidatus Bathyarchaeia archaeon]